MKPFRILLFIVTAIGLLVLMAYLFPTDGVQLIGINLKFPSIEKIITPKAEELNVTDYLAQEKVENESQRHLASLQDSVEHYRAKQQEGDARFWFPDNDGDFFLPLMAQLQNAKEQGRTIRIVHYGDSQIEMDRMTSRLRRYMQKNFGGGGPGMIPLRQVINTPAVSLSTTGTLRYMAPYGDSSVSRCDGHYGPLVHSHRIEGQASTTITASNSRYADSAVMAFNSLRLIFGNRFGPLYVTADSKYGESIEQCEDTEGVQLMEWYFPHPVGRVTLTMSGEADLYGIMVDNGPGVAVDNIPMRGCSGQQFSLIDATELKASYDYMDVGMIILQFGGNSVPYIRGEQALATYGRSLGRQIDRLRRCCPDALILFIGPSDMSTTIDGETMTYPYLPSIVAGIRDSVTAHGAAYWSLYDAMGGYGSMTAWVHQGLAGADHIHFTQQGADMMGDRLVESIDIAYHYFLLRQRWEVSQAMTENQL
ncbi:MAG: hypothetical protein IJ764_05650 [Bacteroidales bacterium]|nr:hypothetical protein [Bacteroidales bacterium]